MEKRYRIPKVGKKQARKNSILANIKKDLEPICAICGVYGANDLSHTTPKSTFPQYYTEDWNVAILCRDCHDKFDESVEFRKKQTHLYNNVINYVREEDKGRVNMYFGLI